MEMNSNINFTARMDVKALKLDKERWKNVSKFFETKTSDFPKDKFVLSNSDDTIYLETSSKTSERFHEVFWRINKDLKLLKLGDEEIAEKFAKILKIFKKQDSLYDETGAYLKKVSSLLPENEYAKLEDATWEKVVDLEFDLTKKAFNNDPVLKQAEIIE